MPQEGWSVVENDEIHQRARNLPAEVGGDPSHCPSPVDRGRFRPEEDPNVEIAVVPGTSRGATTEKKRQPYFRQLGKHFPQSFDERIVRCGTHFRNGTPGLLERQLHRRHRDGDLRRRES